MTVDTTLTNLVIVPAKPSTAAYTQRPAIDRILDFVIKTPKSYYNQGCKQCYENYDVDPEGQHAFVTVLSLKVNKFVWGNNLFGILDITSDQFDPNRHEIHKLLLEHNGKFNLLFLTEFVKSYITLNSRAAQDDAMIYACIISSLISEDLVKLSNILNTTTGESRKAEYYS